MIRFVTIVFFNLLILTASGQINYVQYVNPFIGTGGHGHTYPGATLPHGMVQLSPDTRLEGWDGCGGYHYSDSFIYGFTHTHLSGTGVSDYGDILIMPMSGIPSADNKIYGSHFHHKNEKATAGYYSVKLEDDNIGAEFTATERTGLHHYTFTSPTNNYIIIDLKHRDEVIESSLNVEDSVTVTGFRRSKAWATSQYVFFIMKFSSPIIRNGIWENEVLTEHLKTSASKNIKAFLQFNLPASKQLLIKVAISPVSIEGAKKNVQAELPGWNFNAVKKKAFLKWNNELSKIEVRSKDKNKLSIFYTALYHTAIVPNINMDVDSMYRGRDGQLHKAKDFTNYSVFSLWDTYRAAHPLYTIIDRTRTLDYIKTFLIQYKEGGRLPVWELAGNETDCMIGYHSVPVIVDAYTKGINGFDTKLALEAMKKSANWNHLGLPAYTSKGMIESDDEAESVSKTLEYSFDDFCIGIYAGLLGETTDKNEYLKRAQYYKNMLDLETGFMRPRKNGDWIKPFDPREVNNHFTEANSWQYSFYFPQDIQGYIKMTGGKKILENKLDHLFSAVSKTTGRQQIDITGLIGQYAHGNEPSHHIAYLYNHAGAAYKTQEQVHNIMYNFYKNTPEGLIGNEDCSQMSAWYVLSALGFYSVTPGVAEYTIGTPLFSFAKINLENGKSFIIRAADVNEKTFYVRSVAYSNNNITNKNIPQDKLILADSIIAKGGTLNFTMDNKPFVFHKKTNRGDIDGLHDSFVLNPVIHGGNVPFKNTKNLTITPGQKDVHVFYTLDGSVPSKSSIPYGGIVEFDTSVIVKSIAIDAHGNQSFITTATYKKLPHNWSVQLNSFFEKQYEGGGADGLIDELRGTSDWRKGNWQGYQDADVDVVIDLQEIKSISKVQAGFLQDTRSWIIMPKQLIIEISEDNKNFSKVYVAENFLPLESLEPQVKNIVAMFSPVNARYVRIRAIQYGKLPAWHEGAGGSSHIFIDEIMIN